MNTLIQTASAHLQAAFLAAFPSLENDFTPVVTRATQAKFGHYQCNSAMALAKTLSTAPRNIAQSVVDQLTAQKDTPFSEVSIAGPGFINLKFRADFLKTYLKAMADDRQLGAGTDAPQRIVIDYSSPNIAKEMHVGHLRSTIIGDALARLFTFTGNDVLRLNHIGDWGTAFGMLIAYIEASHPEFISGQMTADLTDLVAWYRASKARFDADSGFKKLAQQKVVALQAHESPTYEAWQRICEISEKAYAEIYALLDVHLTIRGESFYNPMLPIIIADLESQGLITLSEGAKCVYLDGFVGREGEPLPFMVQKSDGGYNYATTDLAAIRHRVETEKADRIIYVTDAGQSLHFEMLFATARKAGFLPETTRVDHVPFGLVLGEDGKKFKTRSGDTEKLIDLLDRATEKASDILSERSLSLSPEAFKQLAHALGIGAVKYADLSSNRTGDYQFSYDRMLRFEGNTAAFLLYAYVRIASIKRKIGVEGDIVYDDSYTFDTPAELALALQVAQFPEILKATAEDLYPSRIADYLYQLATLFNQFFRDCRVEGDPNQQARLWLCEVTARVLAQGLQILGLETVDKM